MPIWMIMSSANQDCFNSFFPIHRRFIAFFGLIALASPFQYNDEKM